MDSLGSGGDECSTDQAGVARWDGLSSISRTKDGPLFRIARERVVGG